MKKFFSILLALLLIVGCQSTPTETEPSEESDDTQVTEPKEDESTSYDKEIEADVIIVGAGGAGLSAALEAVEQGFEKVVVVEQLPITGGSLNTTSGTISAAMTKIQEEDGLTEDSFESYKEDIATEGKKLGGFVNEDLLDIYVRGAQEAVNWLWDQGLKDYEFNTDKDGNKSVFAPEHTLYSYPRSYKPRAKDSEKYLSATHEILDSLVKNEPKIELHLQTKAVKLLANDDNQVLSVVAEKENESILFTATRGVLMTTGGYSANPKLINHFNDEIKGVITGGMSTSDGYGLRMMQEVGGQLYSETMHWVPTYPMGLESPENPGTGRIMTTKTQFAGGILVNMEGKRFVNEVDEDNVVREHMLEKQTDGIQWEVYTDKIVEDLLQTNQKGMYEFFFMTDAGKSYIVEADSLEELAEKMGVDSEVFVETVADYNKAVDGEIDDEFGRKFEMGENPFNLAINKIEGDKYYAVRTKPIALLTLGGIKTDLNMNVLNHNENPIVGLYAAGEVVGGQWGRYISSGVGVMGPIVFGRHAIREMAKVDELPKGDDIEVKDLLDMEFFEVETSTQDEFDMSQTFKDGSYTAEVDGQEGKLTLTVTITDGKISDITIDSHKETESIAGEALKSVPQQIVENNDVNKVDVVSGATFTTQRIQRAVKSALTQATE